MKILFFIDNVSSKIIAMGNEGRLALIDPAVDSNNISSILHGINKERSAKYLHKLKTGEYGSFLEPGSYMDNVKIIEVDFINKTFMEVPDFAENSEAKVQHKKCSKEDCSSCDCKVTAQNSRTVKKTDSTTNKLTKETKMAKAPKKAAAPKKAKAPKAPKAKKSGSGSSSSSSSK